MSVDPERFCNFPFMQLLLQPTGVVSPCCWNQDIVLGKVPENSLEEIWNGEPIKKLRQEFLSSNPTSCDQQMRHIGCHKWSRRAYEKDLSLSVTQSKGPPRLDVRLNGKCNLECVMCDVWKQPNGVYDQSDFWTRGPEKIFPFLKEIDVLGGEPFVQPDTYRLIDEIHKVNQECSWAFVTNGQYRFKTPIESRLEKINLRWLQVSLDSVNHKTYSLVRKGGELGLVLKTIDDYLKFRERRKLQGKPFRFIVSMCVQSLNWKEIPQFLNTVKFWDAIPILQFAYHPDTTSLLDLSKEEKRDILDFLTEISPKYGAETLKAIHAPIQESLGPMLS